MVAALDVVVSLIDGVAMAVAPALAEPARGLLGRGGIAATPKEAWKQAGKVLQ
ncbi:MAG: hypothetical protein Kow00114_30180 [Kiloniellaceae bacterium]